MNPGYSNFGLALGRYTAKVKQIIMFATAHQYQQNGHFLNAEFEARLRYLHKNFSYEIILEEWAQNQPESLAHSLAPQLELSWENVGTPHEQQFSTYTNPVCHPGHDGTLESDSDAPHLSEYGPYEQQENREKRMVENIMTKMSKHEVGLFIFGIAHLHSLFGKLQSAGFTVTAYHWLENPTPR